MNDLTRIHINPRRVILIMAAFGCLISFGQNELNYSFERMIYDSDTLKYRLLLPKEFNESNKYPLVIFLHGAGERGNDNQKQLVHGSDLFASEKIRDSFPAIVIFPQCPTDDYWARVDVDRNIRPFKFTFPDNSQLTKALTLVIKLLQEYKNKEYINKDQIYIAGLSMGAMGTFELLQQYPDTFAAAIAICGAANPESSKKFANKVPVWLFHGAKDDIVSPEYSIKIAEKILENGGYPNVTIYSDKNHNSWDAAFAEPQLLPWLFSHNKIQKE